jgi:hypothetical protein
MDIHDNINNNNGNWFIIKLLLSIIKYTQKIHTERFIKESDKNIHYS